MFEAFRTLFMMHEAVALDWAIEQAFAEGAWIASIRQRYRESTDRSASDDALYESIHDAMAEGKPEVALAFSVELDRRLLAGFDPTGDWESLAETVTITPRTGSDHPHDYWVVEESEIGRRTAAARFVPTSGALRFSRQGQPLDGPWRLLPGDPPVWVRARGVQQATEQGWRLGEAWVAPGAIRAQARHRSGFALVRRPEDPDDSGSVIAVR
ncbi:MAG: hypothetical protein AAGA48_33335 [Myxococcota bacterium]